MRVPRASFSVVFAVSLAVLAASASAFAGFATRLDAPEPSLALAFVFAVPCNAYLAPDLALAPGLENAVDFQAAGERALEARAALREARGVAMRRKLADALGAPWWSRATLAFECHSHGLAAWRKAREAVAEALGVLARKQRTLADACGTEAVHASVKAAQNELAALERAFEGRGGGRDDAAGRFNALAEAARRAFETSAWVEGVPALVDGAVGRASVAEAVVRHARDADRALDELAHEARELRRRAGDGQRRAKAAAERARDERVLDIREGVGEGASAAFGASTAGFGDRWRRAEALLRESEEKQRQAGAEDASRVPGGACRSLSRWREALALAAEAEDAFASLREDAARLVADLEARAEREARGVGDALDALAASDPALHARLRGDWERALARARFGALGVRAMALAELLRVAGEIQAAAAEGGKEPFLFQAAQAAVARARDAVERAARDGLGVDVERAKLGALDAALAGPRKASALGVVRDEAVALREGIVARSAEAGRALEASFARAVAFEPVLSREALERLERARAFFADGALDVEKALGEHARIAADVGFALAGARQGGGAALERYLAERRVEARDAGVAELDRPAGVRVHWRVENRLPLEAREVAWGGVPAGAVVERAVNARVEGGRAFAVDVSEGSVHELVFSFDRVVARKVSAGLRVALATRERAEGEWRVEFDAVEAGRVGVVADVPVASGVRVAFDGEVEWSEERVEGGSRVRAVVGARAGRNAVVVRFVSERPFGESRREEALAGIGGAGTGVRVSYALRNGFAAVESAELEWLERACVDARPRAYGRGVEGVEARSENGLVFVMARARAWRVGEEKMVFVELNCPAEAVVVGATAGGGALAGGALAGWASERFADELADALGAAGLVSEAGAVRGLGVEDAQRVVREWLSALSCACAGERADVERALFLLDARGVALALRGAREASVVEAGARADEEARVDALAAAFEAARDESAGLSERVAGAFSVPAGSEGERSRNAAFSDAKKAVDAREAAARKVASLLQTRARGSGVSAVALEGAVSAFERATTQARDAVARVEAEAREEVALAHARHAQFGTAETGAELAGAEAALDDGRFLEAFLLARGVSESALPAAGGGDDGAWAYALVGVGAVVLIMAYYGLVRRVGKRRAGGWNGVAESPVDGAGERGPGGVPGSVP